MLERGVYLAVSHASREQSSMAPQFWGSPVLMPIPFNEERSNLAW